MRSVSSLSFGIVHHGLLAFGLTALVACSSSSSSPTPSPAETDVGSLTADLQLAPGVTVNSFSYTILGPSGFSKTGAIDVSQSTKLSGQIGGIPAGIGFTISVNGATMDGSTTCVGSAGFDVSAHQTTVVALHATCHEAAHTGSVLVNGAINVCPVADGVSANPSDVTVGFPAALAVTAHDADSGPAPLAYHWSAPSGSFSNATSATPTFTCSAPGSITLTVSVSDGDSTSGCADVQSLVVTCESATLLVPNSLVISTSTYDRTVGAVASLAIGTKLAGTATATVSATAANNYVSVWNNEGVDASFGVTSPIQLTDIDPTSGHVLSQLAVPSNQVVTSFPSKSEVGLHITKDSTGSHLVFVAYAGPGVGALDVSNSDAVPGQDPTNPVTFAFGSGYAFARTIVSVDSTGHFSYTPTVDYGGNNGRSALLGSNGLYYAVGNANNGSAATFGPNGTSPDVTETTGLEVVTPINASTSTVAIPSDNSAAGQSADSISVRHSAETRQGWQGQ